MKTTRWLGMGGVGAALAVVVGCGQAAPPQDTLGAGGAPDQAGYQVQQARGDGGSWDGRSGRNGGRGGGGGGNVVSSGWAGDFVQASSAFADSFNASGGTAFRANRAIDNDWDTQWASLNLENEAKLTIEYNQPINIDRIRIKTQPTEGSFYFVESSWDGRNWQRASRRLSGTDWQIQEVPVNVNGRFMRIHWFRNGVNSPSLRHWSVFEVQAVPGAGSNIGKGGGGGRGRGRA